MIMKRDELLRFLKFLVASFLSTIPLSFFLFLFVYDRLPFWQNLKVSSMHALFVMVSAILIIEISLEANVYPFLRELNEKLEALKKGVEVKSSE